MTDRIITTHPELLPEDFPMPDPDAAETAGCARCDALVAIPDYRPAWVYAGLCADCAAAPDAHTYPGITPAIAAAALDDPRMDIVQCRRSCGVSVIVARRRRPDDDLCVDCYNLLYARR